MKPKQEKFPKSDENLCQQADFLSFGWQLRLEEEKRKVCSVPQKL